MQAASLLLDSDSEDPSSKEALNDRETFSHQTLILTALTAINSSNHHPTFNDIPVIRERVQYMKDKADHTPVIDAATTILVTDTEILATMTRGAQNTHSIVAITTSKEIQETDQQHDEKLNELLELHLPTLKSDASIHVLRKIDELLPDDFNDFSGESGVEKNVFISFPNINTKVPLLINRTEESELPVHDPICKPIAMDKGLWTQIMESKRGYFTESK